MIKIEDLTNKIDINKSTLYRYKTTKPYLYKLIEQGLENENDLAKKLEELSKRMDIIEKVK